MSAVADERLAEWCGTLRRLPDSDRTFEFGAEVVPRAFGISPALLDRLLDHGLPHLDAGDGPRFDLVDLHYAGLRLGVAQIYLGGMAKWIAALTDFASRRSTRVRISYFGYQLPPGADRLELLLPDGLVSVPAKPNATLTRFAWTLRGEWPPADARAAELLREVGELDFCYLPEARDADIEFLLDTRLASCVSATTYLLGELERLGIEARRSYGLLVATPYSTPHTWVEILTDGVWVPVDPLLLSALTRFGSLDPREWTPRRSPGPMLIRYRATYLPLVGYQGAPVRSAYLAKVLDGQSGAG